MTFPSHIQAAVDHLDLPGDVGRLVSRQEADDTSDTPIPSPAGRCARFSWKMASRASDLVRPNNPDLDAA
jgi:hypothetical protein